MFAKAKSTGPAWSIQLANSYEICEQSGTAGPENVWRIFDAYRKNDHEDASLYIFEKKSLEKTYKRKQKDMIKELLQKGVEDLRKFQCHKSMQYVYKVDMCEDTLAFSTEPVLGSLANVLAYQDPRDTAYGQGSAGAKQNSSTVSNSTTYVKEYKLHDIEIRYGLAQIMEALLFLHGTCRVLHRNICPTSIIINKRCTWKLSGFEFAETMGESNEISVQSWSNGMPKVSQPNLDYIAPEVQQRKMVSFASDMYSYGMTICAIFNQGKALIQANHNCSEYMKQLQNLEEQISQKLPKIPVPLKEAVSKLLQKDPVDRPTVQILSAIKFFGNPVVQALQFLDVIEMKNLPQKEHFYSKTLINALEWTPKKLWYQHIWVYLQAELRTQEVQSAVMQPIFYIIENSTKEEYMEVIFPKFRLLFSDRKSIHGTATLLENLYLILEKTPKACINDEVLPMLYASFDNSMTQVQTAAFVAVSRVSDYIEDKDIRTIVLPKLVEAFKKNSVDPLVLMHAIYFILKRLDKQQIIDCILPLLASVKLQSPEVIERVVSIYSVMLTDKKYGLSISWMATRAMPSLLPQTINPLLNLNQFKSLHEILQYMLEHIAKNQINKLNLDNVHLFTNKPNVYVEQRKTSSAEDMARNNSIGSISMTASADNMTRNNSMAMLGWFTSPSTNDNNFLQVNNTVTNRRLSDNTIMTSNIRGASSSASSPGYTTGGGWPIRRHSSTTCPQEGPRSCLNLSAPTVKGVHMTSSSVPYLVSTSMNSIRGSRRPSASPTPSQLGSGLLQQVGSCMVRQLPQCLNLSGPPPRPPSLSPLLQLPGQPSH